MLVILEGCCRSTFFCWQGNKELAAAYGCSLSAMNALLKEMEDAGFIYRVVENNGYASRQGIMLFCRLDPELPVADPKAVPTAIVEMQREKADRKEGRYRKTGSRATRKQGAEELHSLLKVDPVIEVDERHAAVCSANNVIDCPAIGPAGEGEPEADPTTIPDVHLAELRDRAAERIVALDQPAHGKAAKRVVGQFGWAMLRVLRDEPKTSNLGGASPGANWMGNS